MNDFVLQMAELKIRVVPLYDKIRLYCDGYIVDSDEWDFEVQTTEEDLEREREFKKKECESTGLPFEDDCPPGYWELNAVYRKIADRLSDYQGLLFHSSVVAVNGEAYAFTAKSGTGKSTHTNLWLKNIPGSFIVNGDKPIIRVFSDEIRVYGTPWSGKERLGRNVGVPLKAVCFLKRGETNRILPLPFGRALDGFLQQTYLSKDKKKMIATLKLIGQFEKRLGLYELFCNTEDEAAAIAYEAMK